MTLDARTETLETLRKHYAEDYADAERDSPEELTALLMRELCKVGKALLSSTPAKEKEGEGVTWTLTGAADGVLLDFGTGTAAIGFDFAFGAMLSAILGSRSRVALRVSVVEEE